MKSRFVIIGAVAVMIAVALCFLPRRSGRTAAVSVSPAAGVPGGAVASAASTNLSSQLTNAPAQPELDAKVNPYAGALREPGKSKRAWDAGFLTQLPSLTEGDPIRFELTGGRTASGTVRIVQRTDGELTYVSGELSAPETGKFFFLKPPVGGKAGKAVGVIEFPASKTAYRIEPTGPKGDPELWQRRLDEVLCLNMPPADETAWVGLRLEPRPPTPDPRRAWAAARGE